MSVRIQLRRDTAANWTATNPTLTQGEPGYETDTGKIKYGDGTTAWNSLSYATTGGSSGGSSRQIGEVIQSYATPSGGTWLEPGGKYLKASYPELASAMGSIPDFGDSAPHQNALPHYWQGHNTANNFTFSCYKYATDGTTHVLAAHGGILSSSDGVNWTIRPISASPNTVPPQINEVRYLNGSFIAVNANGSVFHSSDGVSWTSMFLAEAFSLKSIAYGNGRYVIVGYGSRIYSATSVNGEWTRQDPRTQSSREIHRVIYANGIFVAVGSSYLATSPDGITWTNVSESFGTFQDIAYGAGLFVAVGSSGTCRTSSDGITWTSRTIQSSTSFEQIIFANGKFAVVGNGNSAGHFFTSTDGITWTVASTPLTGGLSTIGLRCLTWTGTEYVCAGDQGRWLTSPDGVTFTINVDTSLTAFHSVFVAGSTKVFVGVDATSKVSADGSRSVLSQQNWALANYGLENSIAHNGSNLYAFVTNSTILTSSDGNNWTKAYDINLASSTLHGVWFLNGLWLTVSRTGTIYTSSDGISWTRRLLLAATANDHLIAYGNGYYVMTGGSNAYWSTDGITWSAAVSLGGITIADLIFAGGQFVIVGNGAGGARTATNPATWTTPTVSINSSHIVNNKISYLNGLYFISTYTGRIYTSPDAITWTERVSAGALTIHKVVWTGSAYVTGGQSGLILTSPDGITWTNRTINYNANIAQIQSLGTKVIASHNALYGPLVSSDNGLTWSNPLLYNTTNQGGCSVVNNTAFHRFSASSVGAIYSSSDGVEWKVAANVPPKYDTVVRFEKLNNLYFIAHGTGVSVSSDAVSWTFIDSLPAPITSTTSTVFFAYGGGTYMAIFYGNQNEYGVFTSTNGLTWVRRKSPVKTYPNTTTSGSHPTLISLVYAAGKFVLFIANSNGYKESHIYLTTDGESWTPSQNRDYRNGQVRAFLPGNPSIQGTLGQSVASDGTTIVASSDLNLNGLWKSTDGGLTWTRSVSYMGFSKVHYVGGLWIARLFNRQIAWSSNLENWKISTHPTFEPVYYYVTGNTLLLAGILGDAATLDTRSGYLEHLPSKFAINDTTGMYGELPILPNGKALIYNQRLMHQGIQLFTEAPLYSYDTSTHFRIPATTGSVPSWVYAKS